MKKLINDYYGSTQSERYQNAVIELLQDIKECLEKDQSSSMKIQTFENETTTIQSSLEDGQDSEAVEKAKKSRKKK